MSRIKEVEFQLKSKLSDLKKTKALKVAFINTLLYEIKDNN